MRRDLTTSTEALDEDHEQFHLEKNINTVLSQQYVQDSVLIRKDTSPAMEQDPPTITTRQKRTLSMVSFRTLDRPQRSRNTSTTFFNCSASSASTRGKRRTNATTSDLFKPDALKAFTALRIDLVRTVCREVR